jgi:hypothetical protein
MYPSGTIIPPLLVQPITGALFALNTPFTTFFTSLFTDVYSKFNLTLLKSFVDSLVAPLSLVNALVVALASGREQGLSKTFDVLEQVWDQYNVYEKRVGNQ